MQSDKNVMYENTRLNTKGIGTNETKMEVIKDKTSHSDNVLNRMTYLVITMLVMMIILYVAVFVFIIIFSINIPVNQVDGNWSAWLQWSSCDVTCGYGSQSRSRTCTKPTPTANGIHCAGKVTDISACQLPECLVDSSDIIRHHVSFSTRLSNRAPAVNQDKRVVFNEVTTNYMSGYDNRSGIFKAPVSGVYLFMYFIQITDAYGEVELRMNNKSVSATTLYGIFTEIYITGRDNSFVFKNINLNQTENSVMDEIRCFRGRYSAAGFNKIDKIEIDIKTCPFESEIKTAGGNSVVIFVNAGSEVWVQNSGRLPIHIQPDGTTFTGVLLVESSKIQDTISSHLPL
ncbi:uncharacterized protein LOC132753007 [Ruditapes philippinarum]|uniref:uncharacterized protein LOC132753007 n=1 Tax=Ruditapes philippinarum TaxID=129788 RepID=UPI00295B7B74|nr:uncharacterized protein LOC132753007 [Ruditapes philippinarum]